MDKHYSSRPEKAGTAVDELILEISGNRSGDPLVVRQKAREQAAIALAEVTSAWQFALGQDVHSAAVLRKEFDRVLGLYRDACRDLFEYESMVEALNDAGAKS